MNVLLPQAFCLKKEKEKKAPFHVTEEKWFPDAPAVGENRQYSEVFGLSVFNLMAGLANC